MKKKQIVTILSFVVCSCLFLASCTNTPGKVISHITQTAEIEADHSDESGEADDEFGMIRPPEIQQEEISGPTVTPVVLAVVERGVPQEAVVQELGEYQLQMIEREESNDPAAAAEAAYVEPITVEKTADEMKVYTYQPADGSVLLPGQAFHLDVTLYNSGTNTWMPTYKVTDVSAVPMAVEPSRTLPMAVAPGGTVLLSFYMTAPSVQGSYTESFVIQDAYGVNFGSFLWNMTVGDYTSATEIITLTPSVTPTYYSADGITATPDTLAWMCIDPERSKLQDCYQFCTEYPDKFPFCFYEGNRYETPVP